MSRLVSDQRASPYALFPCITALWIELVISYRERRLRKGIFWGVSLLEVVIEDWFIPESCMRS